MTRKEFDTERARLNQLVLDNCNLNVKRFFALDHACYQDGALDAKTKDLLGLVASLVLRCDDCVRYHLNQCHDAGISDPELREALSIGLMVGGSIVIPHLRRAEEYWQGLTTS